MDQPGQRSGTVIATQLSVMMFLQFFVWGAWYVSMTGFINAQGMGGPNGFAGVTAAAYMVGPIAAIISPFFLGMVGDRFFAAQKLLGVLHIIGGLLLAVVPFTAQEFDGDLLASFGQPFVLVLLGHMLCFMPTLALSSSVALHNMTDAKKQFPLIRVFGTIGWIVGNLVVSQLPGKDESAMQFYVAGGAALLLGIMAFSLPKTPPPLAGKSVSIREIVGIDSLRLMKQRSYLVFIICSFLLCIPLAGYYAQARNFVAATGSTVNDSAVLTMSFGQMSEILFMLLMPLCFVRLGVKWMLAVGMLAWVIRYGLFAGAADGNIMWMVLGGVILHGICYDFFFVTGQIYVDGKAGSKIRNQAQGFFVLITQGLGMLVGMQVFDQLVRRSTDSEAIPAVTDWKAIWMYPAIFAAVVLVIFVALFKDRITPAPDSELATPTPGTPAEPIPARNNASAG